MIQSRLHTCKDIITYLLITLLLTAVVDVLTINAGHISNIYIYRAKSYLFMYFNYLPQKPIGK